MALIDNIRDFPRHLMLYHYYFALIHPVCVCPEAEDVFSLHTYRVFWNLVLV